MNKESRFQKACQLERKLQFLLGSRHDVLNCYRIWLNENGVPPDDDGYPSTQAYDDHHINLFVKHERSKKAA